MMRMQRCEGYIFRMCVERNEYRRLFISDRAVKLWMLKTWQQGSKYALLQRRVVRPKSYSDQPWNTIVRTCAQNSALANICYGKYLFWEISVLANICSGCSSERLMQFVEKEQKLVEGQWEPFHRWAFVKRCKLKTIPKTTPLRLGRQMQIIGVYAVLYCVLVLDFKDGNEEELKERWFW